MLGGVLIRLIESFGGQIVSTRWTDVIIFSILVLVLVFVPTGLSAARLRPSPEMSVQPPRGMLGASYAYLLRASPLQWVAPAWRSRTGIAIITVFALLFPILSGNDANIDSAANALAFAALALGLNIVVGFAGLLDLGYAAFFAIGAYTYGAFASFQLEPAWSSFWEPFQWLGLVMRIHQDVGGVLHSPCRSGS